MNTRRVLEPPKPKVVLSTTFNRDSSLFAVGLTSGFGVYDTKLGKYKLLKDLKAGVGKVTLMGTASLIAIIGGGRKPCWAPNKLILYDAEEDAVKLELTTLTPVLASLLSPERIIAVLERSVRVYRFSSTPDLMSTHDTAENPLGLGDMSETALAIPGPSPGQVQIIEHGSGEVRIVPAHSSPLAALRFSPDGRLLATASDKGTIIRVFAAATGAKVAELRRGWETAIIYSLRFNTSGTMLACTSDRGTLHVYDIPNGNSSSANTALGNQGAEQSKGKWGILGQIPLLPRYFSDEVSFAQAPFHTVDSEPRPPVILNFNQPPLPLPELKHSNGRPSAVNGGNMLSAGDSATRPPVQRFPKGAIGWPDDQTIVVVGAGYDPRWERFMLVNDQDGRRIQSDGWRCYHGA